MGALTPLHVVFVAIIALLVLGPRRLPDAARSVGQGLHELKQALKGQAEAQPAELERVGVAERSREA